MNTKEKIIREIIYIPEKMKSCETKSTIQCLKETGYTELNGEIGVSEIISALKMNPKIINSWLMYSEDQRCDKGWYISDQESQMEVGYYYRNGFESVKKYNDKIHACAEFIYHEFENLVRIAEL